MKLDEAKQILKNAGFIVEDTDTKSFEQEAKDIVYSYGLDDYGFDVDTIVKIIEEASRIKDINEQNKFITSQFKEITGYTIWGIVEDEKLEAALYDICKAVRNNLEESVLVEDTDEWDEADMPAGFTRKARKETVKRHNGRGWYSSACVDAMANKHDDIEQKIEDANEFLANSIFDGVTKGLKKLIVDPDIQYEAPGGYNTWTLKDDLKNGATIKIELEFDDPENTFNWYHVWYDGINAYDELEEPVQDPKTKKIAKVDTIVANILEFLEDQIDKDEE